MNKDNILAGKKAVIFDLDDTLVCKSDDILVENVNITLARMCFSPVSKEKALKFYKEHNRDKTLEEWGLAEKGIKRFWEIYIDYIENREEDGTIIYDDVKPCLERLTARELKIGVISSSTPAYLGRQIKKIGKTYFNYYVCVGNHASFPPKPDPAAFLHFLKLKKINIPASQAIAVGNSDLDTLTARNAGVLDILVDRGENSFLVEPSVLIKSLDELE